MSQTWSPKDYEHHAAFVPELGLPMLAWLAPAKGERVLDLGCGDGTLTAQIVGTGARVVGVDSSPAMVDAARARGIDAHVIDAACLPFESEFDAVFSNAALHWVHQADAALTGIARALRPGGRFVAEFGGHLNVASITVAIRAVFAARHLRPVWPWYISDRRRICRQSCCRRARGLGDRPRASSNRAAHGDRRLADDVRRLDVVECATEQP